MMNELTLVQRIVVWVLPVIFAITVHEVAHGWAAKTRGDKTAWMLGRLTLNPIKHIDPFGTILLPGLLLITGSSFVFGWAKPVPVNSRNFRNPNWDMAYVAAAGPVSNLIMALGWAFIARLGIIIGQDQITIPFIYMGVAGISINLVLALVNLIPIPPLDGGRILSALLPGKWSWYLNQVERYGFVILLIMLATGALQMLLGYPMFLLQNIFINIAGLN